ncbi:hypothetical protein LZK73_26145 (plasmid) [Neorhizobium galegae]|nr:hypothetical protein LZK73_26145 [Neorhizobium galegae]
MLDGTEVVYIARASQKRVMSINLMPGSRLPAYCASMGRVLLAAMPDSESLALLKQSNLKPFTPRTLTDPVRLMEEPRPRSRTGFRGHRPGTGLGLCSIAVPLENDRGRVVAAINIGAPAASVPAVEMAERYLESLKGVAKLLKSLLR